MVTYLLLLVVMTTGYAQQDASVSMLSQSPGGLTPEQVELIAYALNELPHGAQLSVAIVNDTSCEFYGAYKDGGILFPTENKDLLFEIGSLSKVFTSVLLAELAVKKDVKLDGKIKKYLPFKIKESPTLKQLANHTSGIPRLPANYFFEDVTNPYKSYTEKHLEEYLKSEFTLNTVPGEEYVYSNIGVGVLGYVLSQVTGMSYDELLSFYIFERYGMMKSTAVLNDAQDMVNAVDSEGNKVPNWEWSSSLKAAGAILSNTTDLSKFVQAHFSDIPPALELMLEKTYSISPEMEVGLAWHILRTKQGTPFYWHNGRTGGYASSLSIDTKHKSGIIVLCNTPAPKLDQLCFDLLETTIK